VNCRPIVTAPGWYEQARINDRERKRRARRALRLERSSQPIYCHGEQARVYDGVCLRCGQRVPL
jgi:hypothetical protein